MKSAVICVGESEGGNSHQRPTWMTGTTTLNDAMLTGKQMEKIKGSG